jgi:hypothetical protein
LKETFDCSSKRGITTWIAATEDLPMRLFRGHLAAVLVVALAVAAFGTAFAFVRPVYRPSAVPSVPDDLPYSSVSYSARDAVSAFAAAGLRLTLRSTSPAITTLGGRGDTLEVDIFGNSQEVKAAGFHDYVPLNGHYVHLPRTCRTALPDAERWSGNVRVVVHCNAVGGAAGPLLRRSQQALASLK